MREGKFILGKLVSSDNTFNDLSNLVYGLKNFFVITCSQRFELSNTDDFKSEEKKFQLFYNFFKSLSSLTVNLKVFSHTNIFLWSVIFSYKGWRHLKGYPVRGQRTWSNSWSSFKANTFLRQARFELAQRYYGDFFPKDITMAFWAEQNNLVWKSQWFKSWNEAKNKRLNLNTKNKRVPIKIDFHSLARGLIYLPSLESKELSKKQKAMKQKSIDHLGFKKNFTRYMLFNLAKTRFNQPGLKGSKMSLFAVSKRKDKGDKRIKKVDIKAKKAAHIKKKKKKKVHEFN